MHEYGYLFWYVIRDLTVTPALCYYYDDNNNNNKDSKELLAGA